MAVQQISGQRSVLYLGHEGAVARDELLLRGVEVGRVLLQALRELGEAALEAERVEHLLLK
eukprot:11217084-Lingulodinium_polyedra.AAC.1